MRSREDQAVCASTSKSRSSCAVDVAGRDAKGADREGGLSKWCAVLAALDVGRGSGSPSISTVPYLKFELSSSLSAEPSRPRCLGRSPSDAMISGGGGPR